MGLFPLNRSGDPQPLSPRVGPRPPRRIMCPRLSRNGASSRADVRHQHANICEMLVWLHSDAKGKEDAGNKCEERRSS